MATVASALPAEQVRQAKRETALVEIQTDRDQQAFGTAFCVEPTGLFVTNAHVADAAQGKSIRLVLSPSEKSQQLLDAKVVRTDKTLDLALLRVEMPTGSQMSAVELGDSGVVSETDEVTAFGYPFGTTLSLDEHEYPSISVNGGRVTALRKRMGDLQLIQVDASLNPGSSMARFSTAMGS